MALFVLATAVSAQIQIKDIKLSSPSTDDEVKPGESFELVFYVENTADEDIGSVVATVYFESGANKLEYDDGKDVEFEKKVGSLDVSEKEKVEFKFNIPYNVEDGDTYDIIIEVEGETKDTEADVDVEDSTKSFTIIRENHELIFYSLVLRPSTVKCDRKVTLDVGVRNIGAEEEEDIELSVVSSKFGANESVMFTLDEDFFGDNSFEDSFTFTVPSDLGPGFYKMAPMLSYDDGDEKLSQDINLTVQACPQLLVDEPEPEEPEPEPEDEPDETLEDKTTTTPPQDLQQTTYVVSRPKKSFFEENISLILIVAAFLIISLLIVILFMIVSRK